MTAKTKQTPTSACLILTHTRDGVTTLVMNTPGRLNGWTMEMMDALKQAFRIAARDDGTKVLVLTGEDPYYCAGVNLAATFRLGHPRSLHALIAKQNQALFDVFLDFPKPLLIAVNGPAIGASVTSATLCDGIIASGVARSFRGGSGRDELKAVNASESAALADAFLSAPFIRAQFKFLWSKKKWGPATLFLTLLISRPLWSRLL